MKLSIVAAALALAACGASDDPAGGADAAPQPTADADPFAPDADPTAPDARPPGSPDAAPPVELSRGLRWVRDNPMFISGLVVQMPAPDAAQLADYFDDFGATAVHLWELGLPTRMDGWAAAAAGRGDFRWLSWVHKDGTSLDGGDVIGGYPAGAPGRVGYQVGDEPRDMQAMLDIVDGVAAVRAADPNGLIVVNFSFLAEQLAEYLDMYGDTDGDVVSYDTYSWSNKVYGRMAIFREAGLAQNRPYWCYLNSYADASELAFPTASDMRWNVFAHATYGFTGYTWFVYQIASPHDGSLAPALFAATNSYGAARTARFDTAAQLNRELANLGRALSQLTSTDVRYIPFNALAQPENTEPWSPGAGGDAYITAIEPVDAGWHDILVGFFRDDAGERYVMVQNTHHESADFPNDNGDPLTIRITFDFAGAPFSTGAVRALDKVTGTVESVPLSGSALEVTLPAGDAMLFKYDTGEPFALQD